ncbi:tumor necrosis factor alpha-induced protein 2 [Xyrauchen texanus]|uniref:tumor necrosis factor alpha-induced protein 2 n=1 Tax=Xyrauchen texanus TaxID=154827 RepID=UPI0022428FCE|nr:tumor necrosis factor alpha-induced protein 2 [Xyrauchen texanus]XP_051950239.1 tumor necrosis factor alpha-induced protein 2 [Xyrauchen texanus]XP_051950247.1 tumor necrosis factor alpha-induced protein 2 [Xyrauchen texanus]
MPIFKKLPRRLLSNRTNGDLNQKSNLTNGELTLKSNHSNGELILPSSDLNPFEGAWAGIGWSKEDGGVWENGQDYQTSSQVSEAHENEANTEQRGGSKVTEGSKEKRGTLERICGSSPLKTLGKLGKGLRMTGKNVWGATPSLRSATLPATPSSGKKKNYRRASEEIMTLLRLAGRRKESERRDSLPAGDLTAENEEDARRQPSFLRIVSLSKLRGDSLTNRSSQEDEQDIEEEEQPVKRREPLSVLEILQLVNQRDLLLADTHIQELERECELDPSFLTQTTPSNITPPTLTSPPWLPFLAGLGNEDSGPSMWDAGLRKVKDVELLYEALQREMWDVVRESLRQPCTGPQLGLVVLVIQQEEQADKVWALHQEAQSNFQAGDYSEDRSLLYEGARPSKRPRKLRQRWVEAVGEAADWCLPHPGGIAAGQMSMYLERLRGRVVEDMDAARRNVVAVYPEEFCVFQVYMQSYHRAVAKRLKTITCGPIQITDTYSLLDWIYNIYNRDVLATVGAMGTIVCEALDPLLPEDVIDRLEEGCVDTVWEKVTTELSQVLDDEEKRWAQTLHIEEYQSGLARSIIQRLKVDLDRSTAVSQPLGARIARCTLNGLADFLYSFQRKVEMFHDTQSEFGDCGDGYVSRTIALVNCVPPFRSFVERCRLCDTLGSEDVSQRAHSSLERIVNQSVRVLTDILFENIRPFFDKLVKRKWLDNTEAYESIEATIKQHFKKFRRMDCPPYQLLVNEVHRRVLVEYVRAIMRGRVICTSLKMRKRVAFRLQDESKQLKALFEDLESTASWLDSVIIHLADIIVLEDTPSIQMEVGVLVKEFPDIRRRHISAVLNVRGMVHQTDRQEILAVVRDLETSDSSINLPRDHAMFSEIAVAKDIPCLGLVLIRCALTVSSWVASARPHRKRSTRNRNEKHANSRLHS